MKLKLRGMKKTQLSSETKLAFRDHWKDDLKAGFTVSLIALPLCLGIAMASGFPPVAGLFAAIVGGLVVSRINGSHVTITGPAAGLIVVNLTAVETLGQGNNAAGYRYALAAIVVAGIFIMLFGWLKAGKLGDFFPLSAVHGMLAAIGVIILVKQLFVAVAVRAHGHEFYEILEEIPVAIMHANPEVVLIAVISLVILIFYPKAKSRIIKAIPAPIWVLAVAIPLEYLMDFEHAHEVVFLGEHHKVGPQLLVNLPDNVFDGMAFPDFGKIVTSAFWISVITIALVTAIESLLSALAVDSLDPYKRKTNLNRDLSALGAGAGLSGLIGGLPMISEIVRSSANVNSGAKTQWSNFFHGGFLLLFLLVGGPVIDHIPLAALAAMLIFTGYRLASPKEFKHVYQIGKTELLVFIVTIVMVLMTDLLIGIAMGIVTNMLVNIAQGTSLSNLFKIRVVSKEESEAEVVIQLSGSLNFCNYLGLKKHISSSSDRNVRLDLSEVTFIDHTVMQHLNKLEREFEASGLRFGLTGNEHLVPVSAHPLAARVAGAKMQPAILNAHQQELLALSRASGWQFTAGKSLSFNQISDFSFNSGGAIHYTENRMSGLFGKIPFSYAEVTYDSDIQTKSADTVIPALLLLPENTNKAVPVFALQKEQSLHKVAELAGYNDIDFEDHPEFSDRYFLKGTSETAVRDFFNNKLIQLLETYPFYHVEGNGKAIIVYRFDLKKSPDDVKGLLEFGSKMAAAIQH